MLSQLCWVGRACNLHVDRALAILLGAEFWRHDLAERALELLASLIKATSRAASMNRSD
jgi:hypothetical protein